MSNPKTQKVTTLKSVEDLDLSLLRLGEITADLNRKEATMNEAIQKLRQEYEEQNANALRERDEVKENIELFCTANKYLFEEKRKAELIHGVVGFQTNPPAVALLNRKYNWKTVVQLLKKLRFAKFVRVKEEVDKEAILTEALKKKTKLTDEKLAAIGLKIDQGETFICEIKWESLGEKQQLTPAA